MQTVIAFLQSEMGRRILAWMCAALAAAAQGGVLPLDYAIPGLGITTGQLLTFLGIGAAATAGSASRK